MSRDKKSEEKKNPSGQYLYAVIPAESVDKLELEVDGINDAEVYPVVCGKLAAIVSDIEEGKLRPERKNLSAHSEVLRNLMDQAPLLPVAFGLVAKRERELKDLMSEYEDDFVEQLDNVKGKVEMSLRGLLDVDDAFEYYLGKSDELKELRDETFGGDEEPSREDKIEVGKLFAEVVEDFQDECADRVVSKLELADSKVRVNDPRNEKELLNLAVLVSKDKVKDFTKAVKELAPKLDDELLLSLTGPWPPYNFVDVRIESDEEEEEEEEQESEEAR